MPRWIRMRWLVCSLFGALAFAGCAADTSSTGGLTIELELSDGTQIDELSYVIRGDMEGDPIEYRWTGTSGSFADANVQETTYTCLERGDQTMNPVQGCFVWTNTNVEGGVDALGNNNGCLGLTTNNSAFAPSTVGKITSIAQGWTDGNFRNCGIDNLRLYCFEQSVADPFP